jgi:plasmid segregation protein ParM
MMAKKLTTETTLTIGLDIGYGVTKAVTDQAVIMFPSVCGYAREIKFRPEELAKRYPGDQLSDDDADWFVGDLALSQVPTAELLRLRGRTADNDSIGNAFRLRMAKVAIGKLLAGQHGGEVLHIRIATGLPVSHMPQAAALKQVLIGKHPIRTDGADIVANISDVMVMPQPYGTIYANMLTEAGELNPCHTATRTGVVDVGTYTIDLALDDNGEYIDAGSDSVEGGVHTAQERIAEFLERTYHEKPDYRDIEKMLRTGCYTAFGKTVDYSREVDGFLEPLRSATLNKMGDLWKTGARIDVIYLAGGGATLVHDAVSRAYEQVQLVKDAQIANARGYLNYATFVASSPA